MPGMYARIFNFFYLVTGKIEYADTDDDELFKDLSDDEFIRTYEVLVWTSPEKIVNDVLPQIIKSQGSLSELKVFADFYFKIKNYTIQYDIKRGLYLVCVKRIVVAEVEVKNTLLFKKIYFHGYRKMYRKSQEDSL